MPGGEPWPGAGLPGGWESALLVTVPEAEPAVGEHRARLDASARDGVRVPDPPAVSGGSAAPALTAAAGTFTLSG